MIDFDNVEQWNIGNDEVVEAALNGVTVWAKGGMAKHTPLYIQNMAASGGGNSTISIYKSNTNTPTLTIYKSNDANNWTNLGNTSTTALTISLTPGEIVYLRCNTNTWGDYLQSRGNQISCDGSDIKVGGNIMSLLYGENFTGNEVVFPSNDTCFYYLFPSSSTRHVIVDAGDLILPATTLTPGCYYRMFYNSRSLLYAPELPATTLAEGCYASMFNQCMSLTTAPELPATTLVKDCYYDMFNSCYSLVNAPELPATTLAWQCYARMFYNCTNLNYIKCLATDISATNCTGRWLYGVASSGIFVKNPSMGGWDSGVNGIPAGWTVHDVS